MRIALVGYGKMGKTIETLAIDRGYTISKIIDQDNSTEIDQILPENTDVAIEFSQPNVAYKNIYALISQGVKTVSGTTGWLHQIEAIERLVQDTKGSFLYASNFSIGVNLFFEMNQWLAERINKLTTYTTSIEEIHHTEKKDSPSGTAITLAEGIIRSSDQLKQWSEKSGGDETLNITAYREPGVPGTHTVKHHSLLESIEIKHTAHDRKVFAEGVINVAAWVTNQHGMLTMNDFIKSLS